MDDKLVEKFREKLMGGANIDAAVGIATVVTQAVNTMCNKANVPPMTSLLARALIAKGVEAVAAEWWAEMDEALPLPVSYKAVRSFIDDTPAEIQPPIWGARSAFIIDPNGGTD